MFTNTASAKRFGLSALLCALCVFLISTSAEAATPLSRAALADNPALAYAPDSVLIRFKSNASPAQKRQARGLVGGSVVRAYSIIRALELLELGPGRNVEKAIETLQTLPFVDYAEPDYVRRTDTNDTYYNLQWGLENTGQSINGVPGTTNADIDAEIAWTTTTGNPSTVVAVIDTGVEYTHSDLDANIWINPGEIAANGVDDDGNGYVDDLHGYDFFADDADPMDEEGHGTHVAGTICAEGNNGVGVSGVAWQCQIMALRFIGPEGGYTSDAIRALDYAIAKGVKVSNNSWGGGGYSQGLYDAISNAAAAGHLFVAAAGNGGSDGVGDDTDVFVHYPSSYSLDNIISVAATDNRDQLAGFSNYGATSVDLGAPGVNIASTMLGSYYWSSGTSMAAPHVSGVAALLLDTHPDWGYSDLTARLFSTSRAISALYGKTVTGGVVNAYDALLEPASVPLAPLDLTATTTSHTQINLNWHDNASDEDGLRIERSLNGSSWVEIAALPSDVEAYNDSALDAETTYIYRVYAYNSAGNSAFSNTATASTDPAPSGQEVVTSSEVFGAGTTVGTYQDTWYGDGHLESITEVRSGGRPSSRYSYLQHTWVFEVPAGTTALYLNAWSNASVEGDSFNLSYSTDGTDFTHMLTISGNNGINEYGYLFPPNTSGKIYVRVTDTDRTAGRLNLDTFTVDQMYILSQITVGDPPPAPSYLAAMAISGQVDLTWADNASDELGFEVERAAAGTGNWNLLLTLAADTVAYSDTTVASDTAYDYRVRAYNGSGYSAYSNTATVTSLVSDNLVLSATGYKIKGVLSVDLVWNDMTMRVDVYRDGVYIAEMSGGFYADANIGKGGGSYLYQICEAGGTTNCSSEVVVSF